MLYNKQHKDSKPQGGLPRDLMNPMHIIPTQVDLYKGEESLNMIAHGFLKENHIRIDFIHQHLEGLQFGRPSKPPNIEREEKHQVTGSEGIDVLRSLL